MIRPVAPRGALVAVLIATAVAVAACTDRAAEQAAQGARLARVVADSARNDSIARARQDSINRAQPGYVIDSIFPVAEEIRRFKAAVGGTPVTTLSGDVTSREQLARQVVEAAIARDSAAIGRMALTPREFIDLVYASSPFSHPPSQEAPGRIWMTITNPSESGRIRLIRRLGGLAIRYVSHTCDPRPDRQGKNLLWTHCTVVLAAADGSTETHRLFGSIIERDGRFKVVSYTNEF